eukprot:2583230-Prorocentrum_lima.AAC.1
MSLHQNSGRSEPSTARWPNRCLLDDTTMPMAQRIFDVPPQCCPPYATMSDPTVPLLRPVPEPFAPTSF